MIPEAIKPDSTVLDARSIELRKTILQVMEISRKGHLGGAFSVLEIVRVLFDDILCYRPNDPKWANRDRFILSKGHSCLALYVMLADKGFFPKAELWKFCKKDGILGGHPESKIPGVEVATGSLGHGLSIGVGFALYAQYKKLNHRTFVVSSDGESNEGSVWEAALFAHKHRLENLTVIIDYNKFQTYGTTYEVQDLEPFAKKWEGFGFSTREVNGHDVEELRAVFSKLPFEHHKPNAIICHTVKGKGVPFAENNPAWHYKNKISDEEIRALFAAVEVKNA